MKNNFKKILAFICVILLITTSTVNNISVNIFAAGTVKDITLTQAIGDYGTVASYQYRYAYLQGATSDYKYMLITYKGDISSLRIEGSFKEGYTADGKIYWLVSGHENLFKLLEENPILTSETETTITIDLEETGVDLDALSGLHMHYGPGTLNITDVKLTANKPEIEESTTGEESYEDIVLANAIGVYGQDNNSGYAYKDAYFTGITSSHKYIVISYVGNITRGRLGFYDKTNTKIGTEMWIDPSQSSNDLVLVGNNPIFKSETGATVIIDVKNSGFSPKDLGRIRVHNNDRKLEITDIRLTTVLPEIPVVDITVVENYYTNNVDLQYATSDYKYMIFTYTGDVSQLSIQGIKGSGTIGDVYWMEQTQEKHLSLAGDPPTLESENVATVVVDIEKTGINLDDWDSMHMDYNPDLLQIGKIRLSEFEDVKDNDVFRYFEHKEPVDDYAYSFAVVGDTQILSLNDKRNGTNDLGGIYNWILDNKDEKNIKYVFGLGDIVETPVVEEWQHAKEEISKLDGKIPYSLTRGNHDISGIFFNKDDNTDYFSQYLGTDTYKEQFANGGFFEEDNIFNVWHTFTVGEIDYLMLALDYAPSDEVLEWASDIVESHPYHNVIISTHVYLDKDGTKSLETPETFGGYNNGEEIWDKFVSQHENIVLLMCGHVSSEKVVVTQEEGICGNIVTSMLVDLQGVDKAEGSTGMVVMLYFSEDGKNVQVECYSTVREKLFLEENQFSLEIPVVKKQQEDPTTVEPTDAPTVEPTTQASTTVIPETTVTPTTVVPETTVTPTTTKIEVTAPGRTTVKKATKKAAKKVKLSIKKIKNSRGYQVQFSNTKKFKKVLVSKIVKKVNVTITHKKFKKYKKLYVRVKAYNLDGKKKVWAKKWSKVKRVIVK